MFLLVWGEENVVFLTFSLVSFVLRFLYFFGLLFWVFLLVRGEENGVFFTFSLMGVFLFCVFCWV